MSTTNVCFHGEMIEKNQYIIAYSSFSTDRSKLVLLMQFFFDCVSSCCSYFLLVSASFAASGGAGLRDCGIS